MKRLYSIIGGSKTKVIFECSEKMLAIKMNLTLLPTCPKNISRFSSENVMFPGLKNDLPLLPPTEALGAGNNNPRVDP